MTFTVIDKKTGKEADTYKIALKEDWAKCLCYCDIEGFAITDEGLLVLMDECGKVAYCPDDRFEVLFDNERPQGEWYHNCQSGWHCSLCHETVKDMPTVMRKAVFNFCPNCGADMRGEKDGK